MSTGRSVFAVTRRSLTVAAAAIALVAGDRWLRGSMATTLSVPRDRSGWETAVERYGPVYPAMVLLRLMAIAAVWYLLALIVLGVIARALRLTRTIERLDRWSPAIVRRALGPLAVVGLALPAMPLARATGSSVTITTTTALPVATMVLIGDDPAPPPTSAPPSTAPPSATMVLDDGGDADDGGTIDVAPGDHSATPASDDDATTGEHVVEVGESFWTIARDTLRDARHGDGRDVTDHEIIPYWRALMAANDDRLVQPGNPDLIRPGQRFVLPAIDQAV